jgi:high-affinity K+ transport system ATPase subunit B
VVASFALQSFAQAEQELVPVLVVATVVTVLTLIGSVVSMALVTATTVAGKTMSINETFRYALRLWWPLTLTVFFAYAVIFAGLVFLLVPGIDFEHTPVAGHVGYGG